MKWLIYHTRNFRELVSKQMDTNLKLIVLAKFENFNFKSQTLALNIIWYRIVNQHLSTFCSTATNV